MNSPQRGPRPSGRFQSSDSRTGRAAPKPASTSQRIACVLIDLDLIGEADLPIEPKICTVTLAELGLGIASAKTPEVLALRTEKMPELEHAFEPLPLCAAAARRFTSLAKLVVAAGRNPKPRKADLMIAAIASVNDLPLYTRNPDAFKGTENLLTMVSV